MAVDALDSDDPTIQMRAALNLRAALAEPTVKESLTVEEPIACVGTNGDLMWLKKPEVVYSKPRPLYAAPPSREWVGLTDDEIEHLRNDQPWWMVRDIEAKLREKNSEHI
jgi:hypothetical protein